jgi:hypothetical protein
MSGVEEDGYGLESSDVPRRAPTGAQAPPAHPALERAARQQKWMEEEKRRAVRSAYLVPVLMLLLGAGAVTAIFLLHEGSGAAALYLLSYVISVPIGVAVFLLCCAIWIGFDAPVHLTALRLAGIYAVTDLARVLVSFVPYGGILLWIIPLAMYVSLLARMLEIEWTEAVIVGVVTWAVKMIIVLVILAMAG